MKGERRRYIKCLRFMDLVKDRKRTDVASINMDPVD